MLNLQQVADDLRCRLARLFLPDAQGRRPCHGEDRRYAEDPHWRDLILFYEYFHGDNGAGLGASHQTGWTGLVALLLDVFGCFDARTALETSRMKTIGRLFKEQVGGEQTGGK